MERRGRDKGMKEKMGPESDKENVHSLVRVQHQHVVRPAHLVDARDVDAGGAETLLDGHGVL